MSVSKFDLHCHSYESDGALSPVEVVERAFDNGVEVLALTDHDTISGIPQAQKKAMDLGLNLIPGIELSCQWRNSSVHILGLNFEPGHKTMEYAQEQQSKSRLIRADLIAEKLVKKGLPDILDSAKSLTRSGIPGRPHFAQALISAGVVNSFAEAFKKYLGAGKVGDVQSVWPELEEVVSWINGAEGVAVIAHPRKYKMSLTKLREMIVEFKGCGGDAIEVVTSGQKQGEIGLLSDLCQRFDLKGSIGSDFHSPKYPWAELGRIASLPHSVCPVWADWGY